MSTQISFITSVSSAALGALIAFVLVLVQSSIRSVIQRQDRHYKTLVKLNRELAKHAKKIKSNISYCSYISKTVSDGGVSWNTLRSITFTTDYLIDLHNLRLEESLYHYHHQLSQDNIDMENLQGAIIVLRDGLMSGNINNDIYSKNTKEIARSLNQLRGRMEKVTLLNNADATATVNRLLKEDLSWRAKLRSAIIGQTQFSNEMLSELREDANKIHNNYLKDLDTSQKNFKEESL